MKKIIFLPLLLLFSMWSYGQYNFPAIPGPVLVAAGSPETQVINDAANTAVAPAGLYSEFTVTVDWVSVNNAWASEADLTMTTTAGSVNIDPPTTGSADSGNATTLTFSGAFITSYDPSVDGTMSITFNQSWGGSSANWSNIVVTILPAPSCPAPGSLNATNLTPTTADLVWTETGTATLWDIEWDVSGFTPTGTPTISGATSTTQPISGLTGGTAYSFYVRADCGGNGLSTWSGPYTFTTPLLVAPPIMEGFATTTTPAGWNTTGWTIGSTRGVTGNPGNNIYKNLYGSVPTGTFTSVNVGPVTSNMIFTFDYIMANFSSPYAPPAAGSGDFVLEVSTDFGATYTIVETVPNNGIAGWQSKTYALTPFAGQNLKMRITGNRISGDYDLAFDNFYVGLPITCPQPSGLTATNLTPTTADLGWTENGTATTWDIEWDTAGFTPTGTPTITGVTTNPYGLSGLTPATSYDFYVRTDCGTDGFSFWSGPYNFVTTCSVSAIPTIIETFEDATANYNTNLNMPCWSEGTGDLTASTTITVANGGWSAQNYNNNGTHPNGNAAYINLYSSSGSSTAWLISQSIDLDSAVEPELRFDVSVIPWSGTTPVASIGNHYVQVVVSTDDGATWSDLNVVQTYDDLNIPAGAISEEIDLSGYSGIVKIGFYAYRQGTTPDLRFYIDNFEVIETFIACDAPTTLTLVDVEPTTAEFSWTASATETNGYEWAVFNSGDDPMVDLPVTDGTVATGVTTVLVTGLTPETNYDFYVRTDCDPDGMSDWEGPFMFTTDQAASVNDFDINSIVFYPNPMGDVVNISAQIKIEKVVIFSLTGQKLIEHRAGNTQTQIDVSNFATGPYLMYVTTSTGKVGIFNLIKK